MLPTTNHLSSPRKVFDRKHVLAATILLSGALVIAGAALVTARSSAVSQPTPASTLPRVQTVRFAIYDAGIYPREARVGAGRVILSITDYTYGGGLLVERDLGNSLRAHIARVLRSGPHWRGRNELVLTPGTYRVTDAGRPENHATLIVEP